MHSETSPPTRLLPINVGRPPTENDAGKRVTMRLARQPVAAGPLGLGADEQASRRAHGDRRKSNYAYLFANTSSGPGDFHRPGLAPARTGKPLIPGHALACPALSATGPGPGEERLRSAP